MITLNPITCQKRIVDFIERNFDERVDVFFDEASESQAELHFTAFAEAGDGDSVSPKLTATIRRALVGELGPAFRFSHCATHLDIYVAEPPQTMIEAIRAETKHRARVLAKSVWNPVVAGVVYAIGVAVLLFGLAALWLHWYDYSAPYETLFQYIGDVVSHVGEHLSGTAHQEL